MKLISNKIKLNSTLLSIQNLSYIKFNSIYNHFNKSFSNIDKSNEILFNQISQHNNNENNYKSKISGDFQNFMTKFKNPSKFDDLVDKTKHILNEGTKEEIHNFNISSNKGYNESKLNSYIQPQSDYSDLKNGRNFKNLLLDCNSSLNFLSRTFNPSDLIIMCKIFHENIIKTKNMMENENSIYIRFLKYFKESNLKNEDLEEFTQKCIKSYIIIYEFLDRGMRGFLSGDITLTLIMKSSVILNESLEKIKKEEEFLMKIGVDPDDFYESFFKLDNHFFELNDSSNITMNLSEFLEDKGVFKKKLLYYVNLKHVQLCNDFKFKYNLSLKNNNEGINKQTTNNEILTDSKMNLFEIYSEENNNLKINEIALEEVKEILNKKKLIIQDLINDIYNEISDNCIINPLKTPNLGILYAQNESQKNLFRRQIMIEENSFDRASYDFTKIFSSLQNVEKAHELFCNKKLLIAWHQKLVFHISEAQKNIIQKQEFLKKNYEYLKYFIALKADEISMVILLYLIKIIINNLAIIKDDSDLKYLKSIAKLNKKNDQVIHSVEELETLLFKEENNNTKKTNKTIIETKNSNKDIDEIIIDEVKDDYDLSIPLVTFTDDLGNLFFSELRNTKINNSFNSEKAKVFFKHISNNMVQFEVDKKDKIKLGLFLTNIITANLTFLKEINPGVKAESNLIYLNQKYIDHYKKQNFISFDQDFMISYYEDLQITFNQSAQIKKTLPMIYPPMPWKSFSIGSYYLRQTNISKIFSENIEGKMSYNKCNVSSIMKSLDLLSNVGWKINEKVLEIIEYVWANGGGKGSIPKRFNDKIISKEILKNKTFKEKLSLLKECQTNRETHSLRCDFLIKLQIAKDFRNVKEFYFPHNVDYRGRTYPISPHLNHVGNDLCRGLLEYSTEKPLGERGLRWLKIHLANVIGKDKLTLDQREEYINLIIDTVHKCAKDPFNNQELWIDTENPWQVIASMIELSNAINVRFYYINSLEILKITKQKFIVMLMGHVMDYSIIQL